MNPTFELVQRKVVEGGVNLIIQHKACGKNTTLFISDKDELQEIVMINCPCGFKSRMHFGSPERGRKLLNILKRPSPEDRFGQAQGTPEN